MAAKQESRPDDPKKEKKYRETVDLESASGWKKWNLDVFHVTFDRQHYTDLREELGVKYNPQPDPEFDEGKFIDKLD